ncbi:SDR family oxidoreductase [Erythrobacter sp.]|jgi:nucleoside-diphosphate-sugar epimerase|uniref:SDR family oxidoreductase n=1 Tax=Erythrobacter sp. TaxID=1042 RepID=UPI002EA1BEDE|nr:SDR family oxidoreductase [Erythrobacter sp.]
MTSHILLFGPTGDTGSALLDQALAAGHHVRAAERDFPGDFRSHPNLETREANLLSGGLDDLMDGIDYVISAVGVPRDPQTLVNPPPLYTEGAVNMITAMRKAKVKRLVTISAAFADKDATVPIWFKAATAPLDRIFRQMGEMERILRVCEDIDWTAVRPGWLLNRERTGDFEVSLDDLPAGTLRTRRPDLAQFMLECATLEKHVRERPFVARKESAALETPPALIEEFWPF